MKLPLVGTLRRRWKLKQLSAPEFVFLFDAPPADEWVTLDCETTGLDVRRDQIISVGAVRIAGNRLMTSERLELLIRPEREMSAEAVKVHQLRERDVSHGMASEAAMRRLLHFIGSRPLVGYYLEFDVAMLNKEIFPLLGVKLPQPMIEVSAMYYDYKNRRLAAHQRGSQQIDLRFDTMMNDLKLPLREAHDATNDAVMAGMAFVKLRRLLAEG